MRLYKCPKVLNYLKKEGYVDEREIWCYAQAKLQLGIDHEPFTLYGTALVCIKDQILFLYAASFNSTELELTYSCSISEMKNIKIKKKLMSVKLSFSTDDARFDLDMDDWKRFSGIFSEYIEK